MSVFNTTPPKRVYEILLNNTQHLLIGGSHASMHATDYSPRINQTDNDIDG
jgi:hypothetical protein